MKTVSLFIDKIKVEAFEGQTILSAALAANIFIPHLCTHPDLTTMGSCNLCIVEVDGQTTKACQTEVLDGMTVLTKTPDINKARNVAMELMLAGHPHDCTSCKVYLNCELQSLMQYLGTVNARMRAVERKAININTKNPLIVREMERCVQCGRCVRACRDLRDVGILDYKKLDWETYIGTEDDLPLGDSGCRFCGACIEVCPTGALCDHDSVHKTELPRELALVPCSAECPAKIDIPRYVRYVGEEKYTQAVSVIREKVPFPHTLGLVCNHRCETGCKREKLNEAIAIRDIKRMAVENDTDKTWLLPYISRDKNTGKKVAVIGGGPCGLTAAYYLQKKGHEVSVFEKLPIAGGMMTAGVPAFRVPMDAVKAEIDIIEQTGVRIFTDSNIESVSHLKNNFDAVLVAIGAGRGKKLRNIPGWDFEGVYTAIDLLRAVKHDEDVHIGDTVNILGGGNVAVDCARTLIRLGKKVNIICLEKEDAMPADVEEIDEALEEGVTLYDGAISLCFESDGTSLVGHKISNISSFEFDETGKPVITAISGSERQIECDNIVFAAGQEPDFGEHFGLALNEHGYPCNISEHHATEVDGVFAAGDVITGTKFIIDAIESGRNAASSMDIYLGGDGKIDQTLIEFDPKNPAIGKVDSFAALPRKAVQSRASNERMHDFNPITSCFSCKDAADEAKRCLQCDLRKDISHVKLWTEYASREKV